MKHIRMFESAEQAAAILPTLEYNTLSAIRGESGIALKPGVVPPPPDPKTIPFYIDVRGPVTLAATSGLQMSTDGKTWTDTTAMTLSSGKTYFRVASDQTSPLKPVWSEKSNSDYDIGGNINSLVKTSFENVTTCYVFYTSTGSYGGFFYGKSKLKSAGNLILPATTLVKSCYQGMFQQCTSLTTAPTILPATTLAQDCYNQMFYRCTSLSTAPELPAMTLARNCYGSMFYQCTSLVTAPALPATTMVERDCYNSMFYGCTSLTTAPALPATKLVSNCYMGMFNRCTSLAIAPELPATTLANYCYSSMFNGCTSLTTAPVLPAPTLADSCYSSMFNGCTNLNYIKCLATNKSASNCTGNWVSNVAASGTFVKNSSMTGWTTDANGIPSGWTVQDAS